MIKPKPSTIKQLIDAVGGCPAFAKWLGEGAKERKVQRWRAGTTAPAAHDLAMYLERWEREKNA